MNEDELKKIWESAEVEKTLTINYKKVQHDINSWHDEIRLKIKMGILTSVILLIIYLIISILDPKGFYVLPIIFVSSFCYYRKMWGMYRNVTDTLQIESTKEYLENRVKDLKSYISQSRVIAIVFSFPYTLYVYNVFGIMDSHSKEFLPFEYFSKHPDLIFPSLIYCAIVSIIIVIAIEILLRLSSIISLNQIKELLKELESE